jgi:hypothetical protein
MLSDIEVTLETDVKGAFESMPPTPLVSQVTEPVKQETPLNELWEATTSKTPDHFAAFPTPMNTTFFVNAGCVDTDDVSSVGSTDTPAAIIYELEQKMRDSVKAIQFKEMLLGRDKHSREIILRRCIEWLQMPTSRRNDRTLDWFMSLAAFKPEHAIGNTFLWHTLFDNGIYALESFKTVISFFEGFMP